MVKLWGKKCKSVVARGISRGGGTETKCFKETNLKVGGGGGTAEGCANDRGKTEGSTRTASGKNEGKPPKG